MSLSEITSLQNTLNNALDAYKAELAAQSLPEPSLNTAKPHPTDGIDYLPTPAMYEARRVALASLVGPVHSSSRVSFDRKLLGAHQVFNPIPVRCPGCQYLDDP